MKILRPGSSNLFTSSPQFKRSVPLTDSHALRVSLSSRQKKNVKYHKAQAVGIGKAKLCGLKHESITSRSLFYDVFIAHFAQGICPIAK